MTKIFKSDHEKIKSMLELNYSQKEISEIFNVHRNTISNIIAKFCLKSHWLERKLKVKDGIKE